VEGRGGSYDLLSRVRPVVAHGDGLVKRTNNPKSGDRNDQREEDEDPNHMSSPLEMKDTTEARGSLKHPA
jgi:hypothetical protein